MTVQVAKTKKITPTHIIQALLQSLASEIAKKLEAFDTVYNYLNWHWIYVSIPESM